MMHSTNPQQHQSKLRVRARDPKQRPQMAEGLAPTGGITSNEDFFIVHHYAPAEVDASTWKLELKGATKRAVLTLEDLRSLPLHSVTAIVECAGMSRGYLPDPRPGTQFGHGMVGKAKWSGPRLKDVLEFAGMPLDFVTLIVRGGDQGLTMPENEHSDFAKGLPRDKVLDGDTLLAINMNDEPLPFLHGGPARMVVPGWYGVWWVKWPAVIEPSAEAKFDGFWQHRRYTFQTLEGEQVAVVTDQLPRSVIVSPSDRQVVEKGKVGIEGLAWAGESRIAKVEVSIDRGRNWTPCQLDVGKERWGWTRWTGTVEFNGPTGLHQIAARATDEAARTQEWTSADNKFGYGNNRIVSVSVDVVA
ncbi:molybdopterin-dependent oxidoreductase [Mesorhizobium sp. CA8]|uniref:molybdopterin-dependent oxidoreductase n=1 Tax=unclassified Mesorhizobium TaxID=325217 RepID=UPI001CCB2E08|nr:MULTISPECIES: molybdopterin-dependent oxidoreductase [unclassified Mesorhizobium]MBZ9761786.1 molybdopterin-dependent oxidoreductase [Mesorhizobium sp. CA8]MBZ9823302.1 molybdopterin-dependent oxidoreductase [Mesorhizobium sp. CA4]